MLNIPDRDMMKFLPAVVLVQPQMGENIGASARAMKNCGLSHLHIVNPRDGWPSESAMAMAAGGADILEAAHLHDSVMDAVSDYTLVAATTARRRGVAKESLLPREAATMLHMHAMKGGKTALLFGGERAGLNNDDIALADFLITAPLNPQFSSLNLGQAVLLMAWECWMVSLQEEDQESKFEECKDNPMATTKEKSFFFSMLDEALAEGGFFPSPDTRPVVMRNIMAMFGRARLTKQDVSTLHGVIKALKRKS